jgi:dephospho-CoA kinase
MRPGSKVVVGVGGNIGAGKTAAVEVFRELGAECIRADEIGWEVLPEILNVLKAEFGEEIMCGCEIDRKRLRELVFSDPKRLKFLNRVSHPLLIKKIIQKVETIKSGVVVIDAALLFDWPEICALVDHAILITSERGKMRTRARAKNIDDRSFSMILSMQTQNQEMVSKADFVIDNNGTLDQLREKCRGIYQRIKDDC